MLSKSVSIVLPFPTNLSLITYLKTLLSTALLSLLKSADTALSIPRSNSSTHTFILDRSSFAAKLDVSTYTAIFKSDFFR